jgi:hypothetical protein
MGLFPGSLDDKVSESMKNQMQTASRERKVVRARVNGATGLKSTAIAANATAQKYFPPRAVRATSRSAAKKYGECKQLHLISVSD